MSEHKDLLGRTLGIGNFVVANWWGNDLAVYSVVKITPKMVRLKRLQHNKTNNTKTVYPHQTIKIKDEKEVTFLLLKEGTV
jgi:hypothetical protein